MLITRTSDMLFHKFVLGKLRDFLSGLCACLLACRLTSSIREVDKSSLDYVDDFTAKQNREPPSQKDLNAFISEYQEIRELYHMRQAKKQVYCSLHPSMRTFQP